MRVLFTCAGGYGHIHPMVPLARALAQRNHDVAFATVAGLCDRVQRAGFEAFPSGIGGRHLGEETERRFPELAAVAPADQICAYLAKMSAGVAAPAMVADLSPLVERWRPDLLVHDPSEFGGPLVAALAGIPSVNHGWGPLFPLDALEAAAEALTPLWRAWGLESHPLETMFRHLFLDLCPPALQPGNVRRLGVTRPMRPVPFDAVEGETLPPWVQSLPDRPVVYVTLGTLFNREPSVFATIVEGLRDAPVEVVVTVGHYNEPGALGPQPDNVHVDRYIPQSLLLPYCSVAVNHGGSGTMLAALSHGLPLLVVPQGADQFDNADRCVAAGVGRSLSLTSLTPGSVLDEVRRLLDDARFAAAATAVSTQIAEMPSPSETVLTLEDLAAGQIAHT